MIQHAFLVFLVAAPTPHARHCQVSFDHHSGSAQSTSAPIPTQGARPASATGTLATLRKDLEDAATRSPNYHQLLRSCSRLVEVACLGKTWSEIAKSLTAQGLKPPEGSEEGRELCSFVCPVPSVVYKTPTNHTLALSIVASAHLETSPTEASRYVVDRARAQLEGEVDAPLETVLNDDWYPKNSALDRALRSPEVRQGAKRNPILQSVAISYEIPGRQRTAVNWHGFSVSPRLAPAIGNKSAGEESTLVMTSGLDPPEAADGTKKLEGFEPRDTLGEVVSRGFYSWGGQGLDGKLIEKEGSQRPNEPALHAAHVFGLGDLKTLPTNTESLIVAKDCLSLGDLALLERFPRLQSLDLGECKSLNEKAIASLAALPELKTLTFPCTGLLGIGFGDLGRLPKLEVLTLKRLNPFAPNPKSPLASAHYKDLAGLRSLRALTIDWADSLTDEDLDELCRIPNLEELSIWASGKITDKSIERIATLPKLRKVAFSHSKQVTDAGMAALTRLPNLEDLRIGLMNLGDPTLAHIAKITSLRRLSMHQIPVTDAGVAQLAALQKAVWIQFNDCGVSGSAVEGLSKRLPGKFTITVHDK